MGKLYIGQTLISTGEVEVATTVQYLTSAEYYALETKDNATLYVLTDVHPNMTFTVTLQAASWVDNEQTVSNVLFVASGYEYTISPADSSFTEYAGAAVRAQSITVDGSCTFVCDSVPEDNLLVNILRMEVSV